MTIPAIRGAAVLTVALALTLAGASTAAADTSASSNWAGYAIHRSGVRFKKVLGSWTQPHVSCANRSSYSSVWVGIGGYSTASPALEQIGTELDCRPDGRAVSDAWYELVPAASRTTRLIVHQGDRMRASVTVAGHTVTLAIENQTRHRTFTKQIRATLIDTTSAEWIVEAPSSCVTIGNCHTLPLADFGSTAITRASVTTTSGHAGFISDRRWDTSRISLAEAGQRFIDGSTRRTILAAPSSLSARGSAFSVTYTGAGASGATTAQTTARRAGSLQAGRVPDHEA